ncbi:MAG: hypothetical protein ACTSVU_09170 [Promethearchaeota archaeon]
MKNVKMNWQYLNPKDYTSNNLKEYSISEITHMFSQTLDPKLQEIAYLSFITHSAWGKEFNLHRGISRTLMQLRLPLYKEQGISWKYSQLNPNRIWATEDDLDFDKHQMVKAAINYILESKKPIPPVVVWYLPNENRFKFVCHDGHHRINIFALLGKKIPVVILEYWIDNRENPLLEKKLLYKLYNRLVSDMPIVKHESFHLV